MSAPAGKTWYSVSLSMAGTAISNLVKVTIPSLSVKSIDYDTLGQTGNWSQSIPGPKKVGNIKVEMLFTKADYALVYAQLGVEDVSFVFTGNEATTPASYTYKGFVSNIMEIAGDGQKEIMISFEVNVTGAPTLA